MDKWQHTDRLAPTCGMGMLHSTLQLGDGGGGAVLRGSGRTVGNWPKPFMAQATSMWVCAGIVPTEPRERGFGVAGNETLAHVAQSYPQMSTVVHIPGAVIHMSGATRTGCCRELSL